MKRFLSTFGPLMQRHLALRRSLGFLLVNAEYTLREFDRYLSTEHPDARHVTREIVAGYLETTRALASSSRHDRLSSLRQFCRFLFLFDVDTYVPGQGLLPPRRIKVQPHIYSDEDLAALVHQAACLDVRTQLLPLTYTTILGLFWVTGLRISEVVKLDRQDVELEAGVLTIRESKFRKSRLVPLHSSTVQALRKYRDERLREPADTAPTAPFFINRRRRRFTCRTLLGTIQTLARRAGVRTLAGRPPRVHDFRHTFATRTLAAIHASGEDPLARLPVLATFLGHANIANTQVYLHPSLQLLEQAGERFAAHAGIRDGRTP
jgi:site-specific recombinase XerD